MDIYPLMEYDTWATGGAPERGRDADPGAVRA